VVTKGRNDVKDNTPDQIHGATFQVDNTNAVFHQARMLQSTRQGDVLLSNEPDRNPITDGSIKKLGGLFRGQVSRTLLKAVMY
jgi:hypothetical protein